MVLRQLVVVDAIDNGKVSAIGRSRNDNALCASFKMKSCLVACGEDAGAFQSDIDAFFLPRQFSRVANSVNLDRSVADVDGVASDFHFLWKTTMNAVIAQKMRVSFHWAEIIDRNDLNVGAARLDDSAEDITADAAKTVNCDANCHFL